MHFTTANPLMDYVVSLGITSIGSLAMVHYDKFVLRKIAAKFILPFMT